MIKIVVDSKLNLTGDLPKKVVAEIKKDLTIENPKWVENQRYGRWTGNTPRHLTFFEETESGLVAPRGNVGTVKALLRKQGIALEIVDQTRGLPEVDLAFAGELHSHQKEAAKSILARRFGVAKMPTGSGKTVVALYCIAQRRQPALVIVHTKELMAQWVASAGKFLGLDPSEVGIIGDGKCKVGTKLTIAIVNSLYKRVGQVKDQVGFLVVDECHRVPARTFTEAVSGFDSRYMLGLSATPERDNGLTEVINLHMGDRVVELDHTEVQQAGHIMGAELVERETGFDFDYADNYQAMIKALTVDADRNQLIARDVIEYARRSDHPALLISDRRSHCHQLAALISEAGIPVAVLTGDLNAKKRREIIEALSEGEVDVLVATTQLIGEGFDDKRLSALFLATPIKNPQRLQQVVGRVLRTDEGKATPKIFDYQDQNGVLAASFRARLDTYRGLGISMAN